MKAMFEKTAGFFRETKQELNKVTWPSRNELWQATVVVIFSTFVMAVFIAIVDFTISTILRILLR
jgi:preprotein translocase subunit SecE